MRFVRYGTGVLSYVSGMVGLSSFDPQIEPADQHNDQNDVQPRPDQFEGQACVASKMQWSRTLERPSKGGHPPGFHARQLHTVDERGLPALPFKIQAQIAGRARVGVS